MVNKSCVPAYRSSYESVKNDVHLIKVTGFHFPIKWLRNRICVESTAGYHTETAKIYQKWIFNNKK